MKVKGTQTTTQSVEVTISEKEQLRILESFDIETITDVLKRKLEHCFVSKLVEGKSGKFFIASRHWSEYQRGCPETGAGNYPTLIEVDADWDSHNNVGVDEKIRPLTEEEEVQHKIILGLNTYIEQLGK